jgi:hypothetical protein
VIIKVKEVFGRTAVQSTQPIVLTCVQVQKSKCVERKGKMKTFLAGFVALSFVVPAVVAQAQAQNADSSAQQDHSKHHEMDKRGDQGMGFAQDKTTHHFLLRKDGGAIQVTANAAGDKSSTEEIRMHLRHIAHAFRAGNFNIPMFVHDQTPPGVPVMTKLKDRIHYKYETEENGGQVVISSDSAEAVKAIHEFLKFQITEHRTGDALEVK